MGHSGGASWPRAETAARAMAAPAAKRMSAVRRRRLAGSEGVVATGVAGAAAVRGRGCGLEAGTTMGQVRERRGGEIARGGIGRATVMGVVGRRRGWRRSRRTGASAVMSEPRATAKSDAIWRTSGLMVRECVE